MGTVLDILGSIGFDWRVALANLVNFLLVFYLLNKFIFSKLRVVLEERRAKIDKGLEDAQKAETELMMSKQKVADIVNDATQQANVIISDARKQEGDIVAGVEEKALLKARDVADRAKKEIEEERKKAEQDVQLKTAILAVDAAERILRDNVDEKKNEEFIKKILSS